MTEQILCSSKEFVQTAGQLRGKKAAEEGKEDYAMTEKEKMEKGYLYQPQGELSAFRETVQDKIRCV